VTGFKATRNQLTIGDIVSDKELSEILDGVRRAYPDINFVVEHREGETHLWIDPLETRRVSSHNWVVKPIGELPKSVHDFIFDEYADTRKAWIDSGQPSGYVSICSGKKGIYLYVDGRCPEGDVSRAMGDAEAYVRALLREKMAVIRRAEMPGIVQMLDQASCDLAEAIGAATHN